MGGGGQEYGGHMLNAGSSRSFLRGIASIAGSLMALLFLTGAPASAQWEILDSGSTADLRGIDNVGHGIAWASGTEGTVLRTTDDGKTWQRCATPPDADHLDFRGIQAFDASTAVVMSSGKGPLSRLYKTTDACQTWTLLFTNPAPEGFWNAVRFRDRERGFVLGDPVKGRFVLLGTVDGGEHWIASEAKGLEAPNKNTGAFAASNSSMLLAQAPSFGTSGAYLYEGDSTCTAGIPFEDPVTCVKGGLDFESKRIPLNGAGAAAGIFSLASTNYTIIAVGGDYKKPTEARGTAAYSDDLGDRWQPAETPPHGYRSAVAYDAATRTWFTVGPNGTDISTDDGRNWRALKPSASEPSDADQHWNALSLPFVVGPHGRVGKLRPDALHPAPKGAER